MKNNFFFTTILTLTLLAFGLVGTSCKTEPDRVSFPGMDGGASGSEDPEAKDPTPDIGVNAEEGAEGIDGVDGVDEGDLIPTPDDLDADGYTVADGDCDDTSIDTNPGASEICDEEDNNCDGDVDEGVKSPFYADTDDDGYGDGSRVLEACEQPEGYVENSTDCDDTFADTNPGESRDCLSKRIDGVVVKPGYYLTDNDCDGTTDDEVDCPGEMAVAVFPGITGVVSPVPTNPYDNFKPFFVTRGFNVFFKNQSSFGFLEFGGGPDIMSLFLFQPPPDGFTPMEIKPDNSAQIYFDLRTSLLEKYGATGGDFWNEGLLGLAPSDVGFKYANYFNAGAINQEVMKDCVVIVSKRKVRGNTIVSQPVEDNCFNDDWVNLSSFNHFVPVITALRIRHDGDGGNDYAELKNFKISVSYDQIPKEINVTSDLQGMDEEPYSYDALISLMGHSDEVDHVSLTALENNFTWVPSSATFQATVTKNRGSDFSIEPENSRKVILGLSTINLSWVGSRVTNSQRNDEAGNVRFNDKCPDSKPQFYFTTIDPVERTWNTAKVKGLYSQVWASSVTSSRITIKFRGHLSTTKTYHCVENVWTGFLAINVGGDLHPSSMKRAPKELKAELFILKHNGGQTVSTDLNKKRSSDPFQDTESVYSCESLLAANLSSATTGTDLLSCSAP